MTQACSTHQVFLQPAQLHFAEAPTRVVTVLGSCVAVTLRDPESQLACICHCLFPGKGTIVQGETWPCVDITVPHMLRLFAKRGISVAELEAKLFGGATAFQNGFSVGRQNVEMALRCLTEAGIRVRGSDTGGVHGRKLVFDTWSGDVFVRTLTRAKGVDL